MEIGCIFRGMDASKFRFLSVVIFLFYSLKTFSQEQKVFNLSQRVVFSGTVIRFDSLLKKVSRQTHLIFSYNTRKVNHSLIFNFPLRNYTVGEILKNIKEKTGLDYLLAENHIILKQVKRATPPVNSISAPASTDKSNFKAESQPQKSSGFTTAPELKKSINSVTENINPSDSLKSNLVENPIEPAPPKTDSLATPKTDSSKVVDSPSLERKQ